MRKRFVGRGRTAALLNSVLVGVLMVGASAAASQRHVAGESDPEREGKLNVAVLLYDGALLLDYGIAAEMFLAADLMRSFHVYTVARERALRLSIVGSCSTDHTFEDAPRPDVVIVPGGPFWPQAAANPEVVEYLRRTRADGALLYSICTGALLLAKAGLLSDRAATTNGQALTALAGLDRSIEVVENRKFVDAGDVVTAAGAGAAIEATLYVIGKLAGPDVAADLAQRYLDYPYDVEASLATSR